MATKDFLKVLKSYRIVSSGLSNAAFLAGWIPKTSPTSAENKNARINGLQVIFAGSKSK
jgi:hypothetical protein